MSQEIVFDSKMQSIKEWAWWLYIGHALSFLFSLGMFSFVPLIINYLKRDEAAGSFIYSHHSWQIRSFWWYAIWMAIGGLLFLTVFLIPVAILIWIGAWLWKAYRLLKGLLDLNRNLAMPM